MGHITLAHLELKVKVVDQDQVQGLGLRTDWRNGTFSLSHVISCTLARRDVRRGTAEASKFLCDCRISIQLTIRDHDFASM